MRRETLGATVGAFSRNPATFLMLLRRLPTMLRLFWRVFWDRRTRWFPRLILLGTLAYVISPVDFLPAAVFGPLGLVDDFTVLVFGCQAFLRRVPKAIVDEHVAALAPQAAPPPP